MIGYLARQRVRPLVSAKPLAALKRPGEHACQHIRMRTGKRALFGKIGCSPRLGMVSRGSSAAHSGAVLPGQNTWCILNQERTAGQPISGGAARQDGSRGALSWMSG